MEVGQNEKICLCFFSLKVSLVMQPCCKSVDFKSLDIAPINNRTLTSGAYLNHTKFFQYMQSKHIPNKPLTPSIFSPT